MNPTYQNRRTGEFFERVWINGSHVGLVSLTDRHEVKVRRSNLTKSYALADDYRPVPPAPDPPEPIGEPLPPLPLAEAALPVRQPAPRPMFPPGPYTFTSSGNDRATQGATSVVRGTPTSRRSETFWTWPYLAAVVLSALFVVVMWIAVLS